MRHDFTLSMADVSSVQFINSRSTFLATSQLIRRLDKQSRSTGEVDDMVS